MRSISGIAAAGLAVYATSASAIAIDVQNQTSILGAAKQVVDGVLSFYTHNGQGPSIPGLLPGPYYWWEGGLMFDSLINYWAYSGDASVVPTIQQGVLFQIGPDNNFMPPNQTKSIGNDDQNTWALAAMTAAEFGFPQASDQKVSWLQLAENVFNDQAARWDAATCAGGLRWQIFSFNNGYSYKNSLSNGNFLQLAARLAKFTGNQTYVDWAQKTLEWSQNIGLVTSEGQVYDGTDALMNCTSLDHVQWSNSLGTYLSGAAYLSNSTAAASSASTWRSLIAALGTGASIFANNSVLYEVACAPQQNCNYDQRAFLGVLARAYARTDLLAPGANGTADFAATLRQSALAAAKACTVENGADDNNSSTTAAECSGDWPQPDRIGTTGIGESLNALEVFLANLPGKKLLSASTTGTATSGGAVGGGANGTTSSTTVPVATRTGGAADRMVMSGWLLSGVAVAMAAGL